MLDLQVRKDLSDQHASVAALWLPLEAEEGRRLLAHHLAQLSSSGEGFGQGKLSRINPFEVGRAPLARCFSSLRRRTEGTQMDVADAFLLQRKAERSLGETWAARKRQGADVDDLPNPRLLQRGEEIGLGRRLITDGEELRGAQIGPTSANSGMVTSNPRPVSSTI